MNSHFGEIRIKCDVGSKYNVLCINIVAVASRDVLLLVLRTKLAAAQRSAHA